MKPLLGDIANDACLNATRAIMADAIKSIKFIDVYMSWK